MKSIDIIKELRKDFAEILGILLYLQDLRQFSESQTKAIDKALQGFSFIVVRYIGEIRKSFGEPLWYRLEDIDKPKMDKEKNESRYGIHTVSIIELINTKSRDLNRKLLLLPGENNCSDDQSKQISRLIEGLGTWRNENLTLLIKVFE